jgi:hypothetical protein
LIAAAALAIGLVYAGPALTASAAAAQNAGSAFIANNTLMVAGTNGADVVALGADATEVEVAFGNDPADVHRSASPTSPPCRCRWATVTTSSRSSPAYSSTRH